MCDKELPMSTNKKPRWDDHQPPIQQTPIHQAPSTSEPMEIDDEEWQHVFHLLEEDDRQETEDEELHQAYQLLEADDRQEANNRQEADDRQEANDTQRPAVNQVGRGHRKAFNGQAHIESFQPTHEYDLLQELKVKEAEFKEHLKSRIHGAGIKWYILIRAKFSRENPAENGEIIKQTQEYCISTETYQAYSREDIDRDMPTAFLHLNRNCEEAEREGTGWNLEQILHIDVHSARFNPLAASSYIPLPAVIVSKRAVLNIQNNDNRCFIWCVLAHLYPSSARYHPMRTSQYIQHWNKLDTTNLEFPVPLKQIPSFEKKNKLRINVFEWAEEKEVVPLYVSKVREQEPINLLLVSEQDNNHYCLIRNFSRLVSYRTKHNGRSFFCYSCLHACSSEELLRKHQEYCLNHKAQKLYFPQEDVKFKAIAKQQRAPFIIYADFESCTEKEEDGTKYQHHRVNSFAFKTVSPYEKRNIVSYRGDNAGNRFMEMIIEERDRIVEKLKNAAPMVLTDEDKAAFDQATKCYICEEPIQAKEKVRDHDHMSGKFRGAAHNKCNLNLRYRKTQQGKQDSFIIPIVFHNLRGYDSHIVMQDIGKQKEEIQVIANTLEKYISFSIGQLRFIDSFQFMSTSLEKLVNNLAAEGKEKFRNVAEEFPDKIDLLLRKGVYPYDYVDHPSKFEDTELPSKDAFYSELSKQGISDVDYQHAQKVWEVFGCTNLGDYHDIYLKSDVLALADVFENFRNVCMTTYSLDPAHYYTSPGLSWDAMLKYTKVQLELIKDNDMYLMMEKGIRGGISVISQKFAKANNPHMKDYNPEEPSNYIMYYDANNLYGWAMSQPLPTTNFKWVKEPEKIDFMNVAADASTGYILEVDLEYPADIHDAHNDYPMAPEPITIPVAELSKHSQKLRKDLNIQSKPTTKLIPNLKNKRKYVLHYRNLQQYVSHGLKITKIHRVLSFNQSCWLKEYITLNTEKRKKAKNPFEKDFFKLMNNSVFGKTMENVRKRTKVELVQRDERFPRVVAKPAFYRFKIFNEDLVGVQLLQTKLVCNKPIQVGLAILDLSKTLMYEFHYDYMKQKYPQCRLLFTDTDSLCYDIPTEDIYKDIEKDADLFDTSDYSVDHFLHSETNKKVLGKMKDECAGVPIEEFVGLRSKMYSLLYGGREKRTAKGITRACQRQIKHDHYKRSLFNGTQTVAENRIITSQLHELYTERKRKIALSPYDDKRHVLDDGQATLSHGHYSINSNMSSI